MNFIERLWNRLPWFSLRTRDGDTIKGKVHPNRSLELIVETQWGNVMLLIDEKEAKQLREWMVRIYSENSRNEGLAPILPLKK